MLAKITTTLICGFVLGMTVLPSATKAGTYHIAIDFDFFNNGVPAYDLTHGSALRVDFETAIDSGFVSENDLTALSFHFYNNSEKFFPILPLLVVKCRICRALPEI